MMNMGNFDDAARAQREKQARCRHNLRRAEVQVKDGKPTVVREECMQCGKLLPPSKGIEQRRG